MTTLNHPLPEQTARLERWATAAVEALRHLVTPRVNTDAAQVRALAHTYDDTDPRLAADLYAAADHAEAVHGD